MRRWATALLAAALWVISATAGAHFTSYDAVDHSTSPPEIRWTEATVFDGPWSVARSQWEGIDYPPRVDIEPDTALTVNDLHVRDEWCNGCGYAGAYGYWPTGQDIIAFNRSYMDGYTTAKKYNVAVHELGHAHGMDHISTDNTDPMYPSVNGYYNLTSHNISDYRSRFDP